WTATTDWLSTAIGVDWTATTPMWQLSGPWTLPASTEPDRTLLQPRTYSPMVPGGGATWLLSLGVAAGETCGRTLKTTGAESAASGTGSVGTEFTACGQLHVQPPPVAIQAALATSTVGGARVYAHALRANCPSHCSV